MPVAFCESYSRADLLQRTFVFRDAASHLSPGYTNLWTYVKLAHAPQPGIGCGDSWLCAAVESDSAERWVLEFLLQSGALSVKYPHSRLGLCLMVVCLLQGNTTAAAVDSRSSGRMHQSIGSFYSVCCTAVPG